SLTVPTSVETPIFHFVLSVGNECVPPVCAVAPAHGLAAAGLALAAPPPVLLHAETTRAVTASTVRPKERFRMLPPPASPPHVRVGPLPMDRHEATDWPARQGGQWGHASDGAPRSQAAPACCRQVFGTERSRMLAGVGDVACSPGGDRGHWGSMTQTEARPAPGVRTTSGIAFDDEGTGEPVVLLHAGVADRRMWGSLVPALSRGHRVIRPDARGFGETLPPLGPWSHHTDLLALLDELLITRAH